MKPYALSISLYKKSMVHKRTNHCQFHCTSKELEMRWKNCVIFSSQEKPNNCNDAIIWQASKEILVDNLNIVGIPTKFQFEADEMNYNSNCWIEYCFGANGKYSRTTTTAIRKQNNYVIVIFMCILHMCCLCRYSSANIQVNSSNSKYLAMYSKRRPISAYMLMGSCSLVLLGVFFFFFSIFRNIHLFAQKSVKSKPKNAFSLLSFI